MESVVKFHTQPFNLSEKIYKSKPILLILHIIAFEHLSNWQSYLSHISHVQNPFLSDLRNQSPNNLDFANEL